VKINRGLCINCVVLALRTAFCGLGHRRFLCTAEEDSDLLVYNARLVTCGSGATFEGWIQVESAKISGLGSGQPPAPSEGGFDAQLRWVIPGLVDCQTALGLKSLESSPDWDADEHTEPVTPELRAVDAINPLDVGFDEAVLGGVTTVYTGPGDGSVLAGQGAILKTARDRLRERMIESCSDLKITLGARPKSVFSEKKRLPTTRMAIAHLVREAFIGAKNRAKDNTSVGPRDAVLLEALSRKRRVRFHAHRQDDILTAIRISQEFGLDAIIEHGTEAHLVADALRKAGIPVVAGPLLRVGVEPETRLLDFSSVKQLIEAGVGVALSTDHPSVPVHYLLLCAALLAAEGLSLERALQTVTLDAARILGLDSRLGSLEVGKDADFVVLSGHPFDITTRADAVFIDGRMVEFRPPGLLQ